MQFIKYLILTSLTLLVFIMIYLFPYRYIDQVVCLQEISGRLEIEPTYGAVYQYARSFLVEGTDRQEILAKLETIGKLEIKGGSGIGSPIDRIKIVFCSHPLNNNMVLYAEYTYGGALINYWFEE
ncbi:MAG: hypothetical protein CVU44_09455 [Chloroflexi bacterium HGW-Chloroflexi-6]|nr:MAG: hypothetical protein CVU44_09455 [Chloroflexi bacterium HGW-Chloroflexi-6]